MALFYRAQVRINVDTNAGKDICTNTYHFISDAAGSETLDLADLLLALRTLYAAFDQLMSENINGDAIVKFYDMEDAPDRVPIAEETIPLAPGASALPNQVAVPVLFEGDLVSGQPRGRRRGRVFIGPLSQAGIDTTGDYALGAANRDVFGNAFGALLPEVLTAISPSTIRLCIFSKSTALGLPIGGSPPSQEPDYTNAQLSAGFIPVARVKITDRFGVQRSRRTSPSAPSIYT